MKRLLTSALALILISTNSFYLSAKAKSVDVFENQKTQGLQLVHQNDKTPELKADSPKLDQSKPAPTLTVPSLPNWSKTEEELQKLNPFANFLKGSVQHHEVFKNNNNKPFTGKGNDARFDGSARRGSLDGSANKGGHLRSNLTTNKAKESNEIGLGIIGVKFIMGYGRAPIIYEVFPGTPAADAGVHVRDVILAVDGIPTSGLTKDEIYNMIVGQPNTDVTISVKRKNDFQVHKMTRMDLNRITDPFLRRDYLRL